MNKTQLVDSISEAAELSKSKAAAILDMVFDNITGALTKGEQVVLVGFGTFSPKKRAARIGRDPRTGGALQIPASVVVGFKAGKALKDSLNGEVAKEASEA